MNWFYNLKISAKLIIGFLLVAIIAGIVGIVGLVNINNISEADALLYEENTLGIEYIGIASVYYQRIRFNTVKTMLLDDEEIINTCIDNVKNYFAEVDNYLSLYEGRIASEEERIYFNGLKGQWAEYVEAIKNTIELVLAGEKEEALTLVLGEIAGMGDSLMQSFQEIIDYNSDMGHERMTENEKIASVASVTMIATIIISIFVAIILGGFISRIISRPINEMVDAADKLALGDVEVNVEAKTKDEIGSLTKSFGKMIENIREQAYAVEKIAAGDLTVELKVKSEKDVLGKKLNEMIEKNNELLGNINAAAEQVAAGAKQISDSSVQLSQGSTEQASTVQQLTSSLEEVSTQTKQNAKNANEANTLAEAVRDNAQQGSGQMSDMLKAMEEINNSSSDISRIIKVIDEIAFQTNILALNAAVEAARAGQHGKGFAVVAEEVRNLAARSANAAKETTELIEGSIKRTENGTRIAKETSESLTKIVEGVEKAAALVNNIDIASNEQAAAIEQINQGIIQVSQVIQANSATSEESAAASEELSTQAELLRDSVHKFKLKDITTSSRNRYNEISPEIIKMIKDATENKNQSDVNNTKEENSIDTLSLNWDYKK